MIPVYEAGEAEGQLFIAMRWVEGTDLRSVILTRGQAGARARGRAIVEQVAAALDAAHSGGLVHRDVKPANVMLTAAHGEEHVYLTDFGLTKRAGVGHGADADRGVRGHARTTCRPSRSRASAPTRGPTSTRSGCLLFHALTGRTAVRPGHRGGEDVRAAARPAAERWRTRSRDADRPRRGDRQGAGKGRRRALPVRRATWAARRGRR